MRRIIKGFGLLIILAVYARAQMEDVEPVGAPREFGMERSPMHREFGGEKRGFGDEGAMGRRMGEKDPASMVERLLDNPQLAEKVGISKEQLAGIKKALYDINMKMIDLRAEMEKAGMEQARLMTEENIDEEALMKVVEKTGEIRTRMAKLHIQSMLQIKKALTPDQLAKLKEIVAERRKEMGGGENRPFLREKMKERFGGNEEMREKEEMRRRKHVSPPEGGERPVPPPQPPDDADL